MEQTPRRRQPGPIADLPADLPLARRALIEEMRRGRERTGRGLQELASEMYSSKATLSRWLNGKTSPTRKQALQWAELCGTDPDVMGALWDAIERAPDEPASQQHLATEPASSKTARAR